MVATTAPGFTPRQAHTFHGNLRTTRYGWLRLTPAYSVRLVHALLERARDPAPALDPFCGTATTLLACSERGIDCDTTDINPFLLWLARAKVARYPERSLLSARRALARIVQHTASERMRPWLPPMHQIERWWSPGNLSALGRAAASLKRLTTELDKPAADLLRLGFCQALMECSNATFGHQSMSLAGGAARASGAAFVAECLERACERLELAARSALPSTRRRIKLADARRLHTLLPASHYGAVITSPPYANRMSYVRELRPYMYWLGYLTEKAQAGALDWSAIGGTWGVATSNLTRWSADPKLAVDHEGFAAQLAEIARSSPLLANYVHKYCQDMLEHVRSLAHVVRPAGSVFSVVGNSKFYDVLVPIEGILARMLEQNGFCGVEVERIRKRSSKKELYEYVVSARRR
jgi:hypothetical protein